MSSVSILHISKQFGETNALQDCSFTIESGEFFSLLGPSGCGKSTLLRIIGGFEQPSTGRIQFGDRDVTDLPPQKRPSAMVFQSYALFPTMSVFENVAYGLRVQKIKGTELKLRVAAALKRVDLQNWQDRSVTALSGGQQQRVALARAMVLEPEVILFDEPLSNLDAALREQAREEILTLQREVGTTALYVTHDQQEALALSDRMAVMEKGQIRQIGTPQAVYFNPNTAFVAQFIGGSNLLTDPVLLNEWGIQPIAGHALCVKPEHWEILENEALGLKFSIKSRQFIGTYWEIKVECRNLPLRVWIPTNVNLPPVLHIRPLRWTWVPL